MSIREKITSIIKLLNQYQSTDYEKNVVWAEIKNFQKERKINFYMVPLDIASLLLQKLYPQVNRMIFTSATLSIQGNFDYLLHRLGFDRIEPDRIKTQIFGSPFNLSEQVLLLIPTYLSKPKNISFIKDISKLIENILHLHSCGTMVLFTSHYMLREVYRTILPVTEKKGIRLLGQGIDGHRSSLLKIFQEDKKSVLFGTNSFWEGIDVPGSALELLIIVKIPFDVPSDPLIEAKIEAADKETGNGFLNYSVPEAIVKLRQGFGRLIRSGEDRGAVLILDQRIVQSQYSSYFLESLPVKAKICESNNILSKTLINWFG
jgi:Rad3-related DNA helicase